jgi:GNAT superfamily N-acetyltransferase
MASVGGGVAKVDWNDSGMVRIKQANLSDLTTVSEILQEAAEWLHATGRPMWRNDELTSERIYRDVEVGIFHLAYFDREPAGTIKFELADEIFWPDFPDDAAAYVHRIAVKRKFAGKGISTSMLSWAVDTACVLGRSYLRLDCQTDRTPLRAIYERFGFQFHSYREVGPYFVARYEYPIPSEKRKPQNNPRRRDDAAWA